MSRGPAESLLPALPLEEWKDTYATLRRWAQVVGKVRLTLTPLVNHWWNVPLYVSPRGLTTSLMPAGGRGLELEFDFIEHQLVMRTSDGQTRRTPLVARSVADFYAEVMTTLRGLGVDVRLRHPTPDEIEDPIPFAEDHTHKSYDPDAANRHWRILLWSSGVMTEFRARFIGKCSPVHFFWGSFDLAVTRFSGRTALPEADFGAIEREAYSHECISGGFWAGGGGIDEPAYYSYTSPRPADFEREAVRPAAAFHDPEFKMFLLPYEAVRTAASPRAALLEFLQSTYEAGARLAKWDRAALERVPS